MRLASAVVGLSVTSLVCDTHLRDGGQLAEDRVELVQGRRAGRGPGAQALDGQQQLLAGRHQPGRLQTSRDGSVMTQEFMGSFRAVQPVKRMDDSNTGWLPSYHITGSEAMSRCGAGELLV